MNGPTVNARECRDLSFVGLLTGPAARSTCGTTTRWPPQRLMRRSVTIDAVRFDPDPSSRSTRRISCAYLGGRVPCGECPHRRHRHGRRNRLSPSRSHASLPERSCVALRAAVHSAGWARCGGCHVYYGSPATVGDLDADLIVGADGARSATRRSIGNLAEPTYTGQVIYYGHHPRPAPHRTYRPACCTLGATPRGLPVTSETCGMAHSGSVVTTARLRPT